MKISNKKQIIIFLGPPGAGKGSQAGLLSERLSLFNFETSKIIEEGFGESKKGGFVKVGKEKYYLAKEEELWKKGILCSPPFGDFDVDECEYEETNPRKNKQ